jgi:hypothetical protein
MDLEFTVDDPPELADHLLAIARRLERAGGGPTVPTPVASAH